MLRNFPIYFSSRDLIEEEEAVALGCDFFLKKNYHNYTDRDELNSGNIGPIICDGWCGGESLT